MTFLHRLKKKNLNIKLHDNPCGRGELFHADGQTDMSKLTVAFRNFANAPKKGQKTSNNINLKEIFRTF
jgi:hypothetical protein